MYAWQFAKAQYARRARTAGPGSSRMQNHYNLLYREEEREMLPLCADQGVGVIPWSPLARGRLTRDWDDDDRARRETDEFGKTLYTGRGRPRRSSSAVAEVADGPRACPRAQVALAWMLRQAGGDRADRRRDQAATTSTTRSPRSTLALTAGRGRRARGAVRTAPRERPRVGRDHCSWS